MKPSEARDILCERFPGRYVSARIEATGGAGNPNMVTCEVYVSGHIPYCVAEAATFAEAIEQLTNPDKSIPSKEEEPDDGAGEAGK